MRRFGQIVGCLSLALLVSSCIPTATERRSVATWDLNWNASTEVPVDPEPISPIHKTEPVSIRVGEVVVWIHPTQKGNSLVFGLHETRGGGINVYDLKGELIQQVSGIRLPYGLDTRGGFNIGSREIDILVTVERDTSKLRLFGINPAKQKIWEIGGDLDLFSKERGVNASAMGVALNRGLDGKMYVFVSRKRNDDDAGIIYQYELTAKEGRASLKYLRNFGAFSRGNAVRTIVADDSLQALYYVDRGVGIRKYSTDPKSNSKELALFAKDAWETFPSGLAVLPSEDIKRGFLLAMGLRKTTTPIRIFKREGELGRPNDHDEEIGFHTLVSPNSVAIEVVSVPILPEYPEGILVIANSEDKTFDFFSWRDVRTQAITSEQRAKIQESLDSANSAQGAEIDSFGSGK